MGYIRHNAIIVTTWNAELATATAAEARALGLSVLGPSEEAIDGYRSVVIVPDGSKEGWGDSDLGDERRAALKGWLQSQRYDDGSSPLEWVEVAYGSDDCEASIVDTEWQSGAMKNGGQQ